MHCIVSVRERDATPVRALPFVTNLTLPPDALVGALNKGRPDRYDPNRLRAFYKDDHGDVADIPATFWRRIENNLSLVKERLDEKDMPEARRSELQREASIRALPPQVFVWRSEFEESFSGRNILLWLHPNDRRNLTEQLDFSPEIPAALCEVVMEGFQAHEAASDEDWALLERPWYYLWEVIRRWCDLGGRSTKLDADGIPLPDPECPCVAARTRILVDAMTREKLVYGDRGKSIDFNMYQHRGDRDPPWDRRTIRHDVLRRWVVNSRLGRPAFLFPNSSVSRKDEQLPSATSLPDYLDPKHPCYSLKLAMAIECWIALFREEKTARHNKNYTEQIEKWLDAEKKRRGFNGKEPGVAVIAAVVQPKEQGGSTQAQRVEKYFKITSGT